MLVRVKSAKEIKQYPRQKFIFGDTGYSPKEGAYFFIKNMFIHCNKTYVAKEAGEGFYLYENNKKINCTWEEWMFHKIPDKDKNGNYLLEL